MYYRSKKSTSWQSLSKWYDASVGESGTSLHTKLIIPRILSYLDLNSDKSILDIGCGNGVLAKTFSELNMIYTGIDSSQYLINAAIKRQVKNATFLCRDICTSNTVDLFQTNLFDIAIFILSIQDIDPIVDAVKNLSQVVKTNGQVLIFMLHPSFKIPRQTGFVYDENRKLVSRRIDAYLTQNSIPYKTDKKSKRYIANFYHRPLESYINIFSNYGFGLKNLYEVPGYKKLDNKMKNRVSREFPEYMVLCFVKS